MDIDLIHNDSISNKRYCINSNNCSNNCVITGNQNTTKSRHLPKGYFKKRRKSLNPIESTCTSFASNNLEAQLSKSTQIIDQLTNPTIATIATAKTTIDTIETIENATTICTTITTSLPLDIEQPPTTQHKQQLQQKQLQPPVVTTTKIQNYLNECSPYNNNNKNNNNNLNLNLNTSNNNSKHNNNLNNNFNEDNSNFINNHSKFSKFLIDNKKKSFLKLFVIYIIIYTTIFSQSVTLSMGNQLVETSRLGKNKTNGVCQSVEIRMKPDELKQLFGCRVVEGHILIALMDKETEDSFLSYRFPELVEVTDYIMFYRVKGIKSLNHFFPNLAVIRGKELFTNYALIIYEMFSLEEIGLTSLRLIERGYVRIEKNTQLCFADKIDWTLIATAKDAAIEDHYIAGNQGSETCPLCPMSCPKPTHDTNPESKRRICWNMNTCQNNCLHECGDSGCNESGTCCDEQCLGGCYSDINDCIVCRNYTYFDGVTHRCSNTCPPGLYKHYNRRCITAAECRGLNELITNKKEDKKEDYYNPFQDQCYLGCPAGYTQDKDGDNNYYCKKCQGPCLKVCSQKIIDSISAAQQLQGCAIIQGSLEIQIRSQGGRGANIIKELENSLSSIIEITGYLKIARSYPIVSLSFLKNLQRIKGNRLDQNKHSLIVLDNQNLQELWPPGHKVVIERGNLFFHFNPKLCFYKIKKLLDDAGNMVKIENEDIAHIYNGDKTVCNVTTLNVTAHVVNPYAVLLEWDPLNIDDERSLLGYVVSYIVDPNENITLFDGRDACGTDGWRTDDVTDFAENSKVTFPLTRLEPYTNYAYYVKTYTIASEKTGAQSPIGHFRTAPGKPELVRKLKVTPKSSSEIIVTWERPRKINGNLTHYKIIARKLDKNLEETLQQRNYCESPISPLESSIMPTQRPEPPVKETPPKELAKCDCSECLKKRPDEEIAESAIDFENQIQDHVYIKYHHQASRKKRDLDVGLDTTMEFPVNGNDTSKDQQTVTKNVRDEGDNTFVEFVDIVNGTTHQYVLTELKHFARYEVAVIACRDGEVKNNVGNCSTETHKTEKTMKMETADNFRIEDIYTKTERTNGTNGNAVRIFWKNPPNPNGIIVAVTIMYKRIDEKHHPEKFHCIAEKSNTPNTTNSFLLTDLDTGNYSYKLQATSLAGKGQQTKPQYFYISKTKSYTSMWVIGVLLAIILPLIALVAYKCQQHFRPNISSMKLIASVNPDYAGVIYKQDDWEVPRENIIQMQELGQGSFGMVYQGIIKHLKREGEEIPCAIKTVNENATDKERLSFLNEASVMKQFDTHHVVRLLGVVSRGQPTLVIMELMSNGDLKGYLRSHRPEYENGTDPPPQPPTLRRILQMAIEIADGMAYLAAKKFVHRDLAARNCMVADDLTVKIGDFGMTRDIYETDYYRKGTKGLLPVRWMSPESLKDGVFTSSSDVFSYGVVLWEMATLASQPYQGLSNDQVLRYVIDGGVMERPENCPDKLYELMVRCWQHRPSARPTFLEIIMMLIDDVSPKFKSVSFFNSPEGQDAVAQTMQAVHVIDDVTTPLRQDEDETSSIDGNHYMDDGNPNRLVQENGPMPIILSPH